MKDATKPMLKAVFIAMSVMACGSSDEGRLFAPQTEAPPGSPSAPGSPPSTPPSVPTSEPPPARVVPATIDPTRPAFQAKSAAQLASSVKACVGTGATTITQEMIIGSPGGFLTTDFAAGQNVVDRQRSSFDGSLESLRTSVRVDQVTLEYVTALRNTGNVVGYHCGKSLVDDPSLCACDTFTAAYGMLSRCLGTVADPTTAQFSQLAADFQTACQANKGSAIASLVASSAFAKLP